jgi:hypothetical protein
MALASTVVSKSKTAIDADNAITLIVLVSLLREWSLIFSEKSLSS